MAANWNLVQRDALGALGGELAAASSDAVRIDLVPPRSLVNLRGPATNDFVGRVEEATGFALSLEPNRWTGDLDRAAIWLGPDEWLLLAADGEAHGIAQAIRGAWPNEQWLSIVDVSHNHTSFLLAGSSARELIARGCPLDLDPSVFGAGDCAQTQMAKTRLFIRMLDGKGALEICVRNSFARYTAQWLLEASTALPEYKSPGR
jgi:sarcosine oxidase, subunit gamma